MANLLQALYTSPLETVCWKLLKFCSNSSLTWSCEMAEMRLHCLWQADSRRLKLYSVSWKLEPTLKQKSTHIIHHSPSQYLQRTSPWRNFLSTGEQAWNSEAVERRRCCTMRWLGMT